VLSFSDPGGFDSGRNPILSRRSKCAPHKLQLVRRVNEVVLIVTVQNSALNREYSLSVSPTLGLLKNRGLFEEYWIVSLDSSMML